MSVTRRKDRKCWMVHIKYKHPDGTVEHIRRKSPVNTRRGAERYERDIRQALLDGTFERKEEIKEIPTLGEFAKEFIENYATVHNKRSEVISKQGNLKRYLIPAWGHLRLDKIRVRNIDQLKYDILKRGLSPKTINNTLATLSKMLHYAEDLEIIDYIPRIRHLRVPDTEFDFLTFDEADRLLKAADYNPEWRGMIFFAIKTGLRWGELSELRWSDIDLVERRMRVQRNFSRGEVTDRKNRTAYTLPLSPDTVEFLKNHRHLKGELVFCKEDGGRHIHRRGDVAIKRACRKAGLRLIGWHTLRHTFASHLAMRERSLLEIKELLGHKDIKSTIRYAHLMPEKKHEAIAVLDDPAPLKDHHRITKPVLESKESK